MIARPLRRTGPIPFAPFPPLGERATAPATREARDTRARSRWMPALSLGQPGQPAARTAHTSPAAGTWTVLQAATPPSRQGDTSRTATAPGASPSPLGPSGSPARPSRGNCHAVYHGHGTLSVLSSITGHHYRFEGRGCTLTIDPRDRLVLGRLSELSIHSSSS